MDSPSKQISLMSRDSDLCRFWADTYGLIADSNKTIYAGNIIDEHGYDFLFKKIQKNIFEDNVTQILIDISTIQFNPYLFYDLKKNNNLQIIVLAIDDEMKFSWISATLATLADLVITSDFTSVMRYRQSGINAHFLPLPVYIPDELPLKNDKLQQNISFIGRKAKDKPSREIYLNVLEKETNASIFGNQGSETKNFLSTEEMYSIFSNSLVNLNFTGITVNIKSDNILFERIRGMKLRPFEIYAAGGVCISEYSISLAKCFKDGEEIIFFNNPKEMLEKIYYYLDHREEAERIAAAGRSKVIKNYSSEATAANLKDILNKSIKFVGKDLFEMPQKLSVSPSFAVSFVELTFGKIIDLLLSSKFRECIKDFLYILRFLKCFLNENGLILTIRIVLSGLLRSLKTIASRIRSLF